MIEKWSSGNADENMPEAILVETLALVRRHPWWRARARLALTILRSAGIAPPQAVLDVGCGWGVNLDELETAGYGVAGLDISPQILQWIDRPGRRLIEADLNQSLPDGCPSFEGALLLDVLEHLDDDRGALRRIAPLLRPGGTLVASVPALPELFSEFDEIQGHRRRYVPETLTAAFEGTGFVLERTFWWGGWMVPVLRRMRKKGSNGTPAAPKTYADYLRLPPWPAPLLMRALYAWDQRQALAGNLRTGTSLFAVAQRRP
jgi:2-polyprenyl-3-methyl-5-hydroxy-6-metoxy-1,4-benzoquinol methylase